MRNKNKKADNFAAELLRLCLASFAAAAVFSAAGVLLFPSSLAQNGEQRSVRERIRERINARRIANTETVRRDQNVKQSVVNQSNVLLKSTETSNEDPPRNPHLADSPWAIFHRNNHAQKSTNLRGPESGDSLVAQFQETPANRVSPWTVLGEKYGSGERPVYGSNATHLFKALVKTNDDFEMVAEYQIDREIFDLNWQLAVLRGNKVIVSDRNQRRFLRFADEQPNNPRSPIKLEASWEMPSQTPGKPAAFAVSYDGYLVFITDEGFIAAVKLDFSETKYFDINQLEGDVAIHNNYPMDEQGRVYVVSNNAMTRIDWDGQQFRLGWRSQYDFVGPGCERVRRGRLREIIRVATGQRCTGSGTTPTLMGTGNMDKLVLVTDGHAPSNNLVAFWRDAIPADWQGIPGYDRRVAAVTKLPYATPEGEGYSVENSPPVRGYDVAVAQWNGFKPDCNPLTGVQKLRWNPQTRKLDIAWATNQINMNGVLTYSAGSNLVYSSGRSNCTYYFYGLDWDTGAIKIAFPLGDDPQYLDQGNQSTLNDDRSIIFGTSKGILRIILLTG